MRDPARIEQVLAALAAYWSAHADLRLGQIVMNAYRAEWQARRETPEYRAWLAADPDNDDVAYARLFNVEDDRLARGIELLAEFG